MENQKLENVLNLALNSTEEEREKSQELNVGYDVKTRDWELIIKYSGSLECVRELGAEVVELLNGFAIVTIKENRIEELANCVAVEYVEKPKRLFFQILEGKVASCITSVQRPPLQLTGKDVLVAIIDSGIDYENLLFRKTDGSTRIKYLWDQTIAGNPPRGYKRGTEYTEEEINEAIKTGKSLPTTDISGHGTAVAGIAVGNAREYQGVAFESELLIVKMGIPMKEGFPRTTELMQGIDYVIKKARELEKPVAINISFGNTYGAHDGSSLLERFIESVSNNWKSVICIGTGNEGIAAGHFEGILKEDEVTEIELAVQDNTTSLNVQIWKGYFDEMDISLRTPSGARVGPIQNELGSQKFTVENTQILLYYGEPSPFSVDQEIFIEFISENVYIDGGVWKVELMPKRIVNGAYALWLPSEGALNRGTGFLFPKVERTLTIPSTSYGTIGVGAYDSRTMIYAEFSGRGPAGPGRRAKPDIVAPGVEILVPTPGGTFIEASGTSFATPFVTGAAALMMEWGIIKGNDRFLYGEKVKAYLQEGAKHFPGMTEYPNQKVGYGALCVEQSFPRGIS